MKSGALEREVDAYERIQGCFCCEALWDDGPARVTLARTTEYV